MEVQNLKTVIEKAIPSGDHYDSTATCRRISDLVINRIESTLVKLRQDVNIFVYENTQLQVTKARINADLEKCIHDKNIVTSEKNNLAEKKASIEKDLGTKKDELYACQSQYLKKDAELASCQKPPMRPPVLFPPLRT
ncbi:unnamed protein product [Staurois parvus]|uniref:Uncharacterized protein n=1 Tax=Staurois parvus TaxID=386267 RepID=A0ABN9EC70_9NEOB|nr:unnamed protein product [Staurois parvus]